MVSLPAWLSWQPWHDRWRKSLRDGKVSTLLIWALNVPLLEHSLTIDALWPISPISHFIPVLNCFKETRIYIYIYIYVFICRCCFFTLQWYKHLKSYLMKDNVAADVQATSWASTLLTQAASDNRGGKCERKMHRKLANIHLKLPIISS